MSNLLEIIGKFHPLLLHLPIGVLVYAYLHLGFDLWVKKKNNSVDINFALIVGATTAILSSISGYLLSLNGEYQGELLDWHKLLGIGTALGSVLLYVYYHIVELKKHFFGVFTAFMILLTVTGHYGGSLTHGEGFLTISSTENEEQSFEGDISTAHVFNDLVMPIVKKKCVSCHNPKKQKGKLLLNTLEGWKKGGEEGQFMVPENQDQSLLLTRIHLPLSEKKHMPPKGKLQLDAEEIAFIDWWTTSMTHYDHTVGELTPPEHIMKYINGKLDVTAANVPPLEETAISNLQQAGIPAIKLSAYKPWIRVEYDRGNDVKMKDIKKLLKYKENVREMKLSKTKISDKMLSKINEFSNLKSLDISLNEITVSGISKLKDLHKLETLNLYGTSVDAKVLDYLKYFPNLQNLYLWQTEVRSEDLVDLDLSKGPEINVGQNLEVFGNVQLLPPTIENEEVIFKDSLIVTISHVAKKSKIHFTTDGKAPSPNSPIYQEPILLTETSVLSAMASLEGWEDSDVKSQSFLKASCIPLNCNITPPPNEKYKADGNITLINSVKGSEQFGDGKWLGFSGQDVSITLDLGEEKEVSSVSFGCLRDYRSYIFTPIGSALSISKDGKIFELLKKENYDQITGPADNLVKNIIVDIPDSNTRFIKLDITAQKINPKWHADPGADAWLFLDEIVVD